MGYKRKPRRGGNSSSNTYTRAQVMSCLKRRQLHLREDLRMAVVQLKRNKILARNKEDKVIRMLEQIEKQLNRLTESHNVLRKRLELHINNGSSGDHFSTPRSETDQDQQPPKYRLEFTCELSDEIEKGQAIETKNHGKTITIVLYDDHNQIVRTGPLASANVMLVVFNGDFNKHGNRYNWSKRDFERNIKRPRQGNSAAGDQDETQSNESTVSNCLLKLDGGVKSHSGATILYNSSNKKVRLGVMVLSPTEERVLEGLSNLFFVRGHDRPARKCIRHHGRSKRRSKFLFSLKFYDVFYVLLYFTFCTYFWQNSFIIFIFNFTS